MKKLSLLAAGVMFTLAGFAQTTPAASTTTAPAQMKDLTAALNARVGKDVQLVTSIDQTLLGGLTVKIGSILIDNSLKTKLQNLKVSMKGSA